MSAPERIQRRRTRGWRMPDGAIYVGRPSRWGNPFRGDNAEAVQLFDNALRHDSRYGFFFLDVPGEEARWMPLHRLTGLDLACWCPLDKPCHADVLLALANKPSTPAVTGGSTLETPPAVDGSAPSSPATQRAE